MSTASNFALDAVQLSIGGIEVSAYGDSGAVNVAWNTPDLAEVTVGLGGDLVFNKNTDRSAIATLTLIGSARAIPLLEGLLDLQWGLTTGITPPILLPIDFSLFDPATGNKISCRGAVFMARPAMDIPGIKLADVQYRLHLIEARRAAAPLNLLNV